MEKKTEQSKKSLAIWGIPIAILVILIVVLIFELNNDEDAIEPPAQKEEVVIQATEGKADDVTMEVQPRIDAEEKSAEESTVEEQTFSEDASNLQPEPFLDNDDEAEKSYIVEEGDNLWKIAKKKDVLGDPWKWKTILIQNKSKINYTIFSEETGQWKVMVDAGKRLIVKSVETSKSNTSFDRTRKKRYAVQLMSLNTDQLDKGVDIVKFLIKDGFHAYLYRTREKIKRPNLRVAQFFYRIRVGFFETEREALASGEDIVEQYKGKNIFSSDYWAVLPSYSELNGELIDFGIQRNKPWIIQLTDNTNRKDAINSLKPLASLVDYSYISQKREKEGGFLYRTRVGFYETKGEANRALANIQRKVPDRFYNPQVLEIKHVMEDAIGQSTGNTSLEKLR
ncbi:MAG: SPOR domain-containing protein [SAR324 cluster bacterium]|nr:SPOR domain-containing protein [SAR324 cluster bacterium]